VCQLRGQTLKSEPMHGGTRRAWIEFATIMMVAVALAGCTPEQDVAKCEVEAMRLYPNNPPKDYNDVATRYVVACMTAKGYEFIKYPWKCSGKPISVLSDPPTALLPGCYKSADWLAQFLALLPDRPHPRRQGAPEASAAVIRPAAHSVRRDCLFIARSFGWPIRAVMAG